MYLFLVKRSLCSLLSYHRAGWHYEDGLRNQITVELLSLLSDICYVLLLQHEISFYFVFSSESWSNVSKIALHVQYTPVRCLLTFYPFFLTAVIVVSNEEIGARSTTLCTALLLLFNFEKLLSHSQGELELKKKTELHGFPAKKVLCSATTDRKFVFEHMSPVFSWTKFQELPKYVKF